MSAVPPPPADPADPAALAAGLPAPVLVLVDDTDPDVARWARLRVDGRVLPLSELVDDVAGGWGSLLLVARDRAALRRAVSGLARTGRVPVVACWLVEAAAPLTYVPGAGLPLEALTSRRTPDGGALLVARFGERVPGVPTLVEIARQAVPGGEAGGGGLVVGRAAGTRIAGLDPGSQPYGAEGVPADRVVPPDVVLGPVPVADHPVLGRPPVVVTDPGPEPIDERAVNPVGYRRTWTSPVATLKPDATVAGLDLSRGVTERHVRELRDVQGVRVTWPRLGRGRTETVARAVVGLAAAGVPVLAGWVPDAGAAVLGGPLTEALTAVVDLDDPLARDELSVRSRRAALDTHSTLAWRARLAGRAGVRFRGLPPVSVVLATRRPEMLDFALRQVARQRGAELELVLAAHGFAPDPSRVIDALPDREVTVLTFPAETAFGDVLTGAVRAAGGEAVLKMDDDDWYAPDFVHDLLLARHYSGADLVGMPAEWIYLAEPGLTVRRTQPTEVYDRFVAGGTILVDRGLLRAVGDFRAVRRFVDAQLLAAVRAAGGTTYRTHGLGYVLRREASGHTWSQDPEHFRDPQWLEREWPGFRPSALMELADEDRP